MNNIEYKLVTLPNGLRIVACPMPGMESVTFGLWAAVGGRYEKSNVQGISHFLEHLMFKGSKTRSARKISRTIEGVGGQLNAYTSEEFTCYLVKVRSKHQTLATNVILDMVENPLLNKKDIEKERMVIMEELHMVLDHPAHYVHEIIQELMWAKHPLGRMLIGTRDSIAAIKREDIVNFKKQYYYPENMLISVAGNLDSSRLINDAKKYFHDGRNHEVPECVVFENRQKKVEKRAVKKQTNQFHVCFGFRSVSRNDPDRYTTKLISIILGENMSSRLFQVIREKHGLAYDISSGVSYFKDTGGFVVSAGIKQKKLQQYVDLVLRELRKIKEKPIKKDELDRAKEYYQGQLALGFEKTLTRMLWSGEQLLTTGKVPLIKDVYRNVQKVSVADIKRISKKIFVADNLCVAIVGPEKAEVKIEL